eukprot:TRINITY_DN1915_c0_g1_i1.p1 TRINITY_DN1915_c0_g1~~TRINITY_DN1915_c0_g1_i1.p1  ORF type:complete len:87 (-),score=2.88 TRINITY_DN1915_c0_g1_i1:69-290(-)
MVHLFSFEGLFIMLFLIIGCSTIARRSDRLKKFLLNDREGAFSLFHKASIIGLKLHYIVAPICALFALYILIR